MKALTNLIGETLGMIMEIMVWGLCLIIEPLTDGE